MKKVLFIFISILLISTLLTSCWSYVGLESISIVTGVAVDYDFAEEKYMLNFELVDTLGSSKESGLKTLTLSSEGETIFAAIRNAKDKLTNKLFFGNCMVLIIGGEVAKEKGILDILNFFLRDHEPRETMSVLITNDVSAKDIFLKTKQDRKITSKVLQDIVEEDKQYSNSTVTRMLYELYDQIKKDKVSLLLPAVYVYKEGEQGKAKVKGVAVFKEDKVVGYLDERETKHLLFALDEVKRGEVGLDVNEDGINDASFEIEYSKTKSEYQYKDGKVSYKLDIKLQVALVEAKYNVDCITQEDLTNLEELINKQLSRKVVKAIQNSQTKLKSDYVGIGKAIYLKDYKLWNSLEKQWEELYPQCDVAVSCNTRILSTGLIE